MFVSYTQLDLYQGTGALIFLANRWLYDMMIWDQYPFIFFADRWYGIRIRLFFSRNTDTGSGYVYIFSRIPDPGPFFKQIRKRTMVRTGSIPGPWFTHIYVIGYRFWMKPVTKRKKSQRVALKLKWSLTEFRTEIIKKMNPIRWD
jgi:hypothetical protein